jgi:long-chain acyl-CoA synthetase
MNICEHVERGSRDYPERAALVWEGNLISYAECEQRSSQAAGVFAAGGVKVADRVALFLPNSPDFVFAYLGALKLGAIAVSLNATQTEDETAFALADCAAAVAVTTHDLRHRIKSGAVPRIYSVDNGWREALESADGLPRARPMQPHDPAAIVYTSGTTGRPKGATLSHGNVVRNIEAKQRYLGIQPRDRGLLFMPLYHCFAQNAILNAFLHAGATVVMHPRFDFDRVLDSIADDGVTMFFGVPTTFILLLDKVSPAELSGVRYFFSAAAPLPLEVEKRWAGKFGAPIYQGYGLSETSPFASYNHVSQHRPGSIGTPIEGVEMRIVHLSTSGDAAPQEKGEIAIRGHNVMLGYWNEPAETAKVIRDGWFHTGDIGSMDKDGYFFILDRLSDMIICGGVNVYPAEIENVLAAHFGVKEAAVYGVPEPLLGEQVCAEIVLKPGVHVSAEEIRSFCRQHLSPVKVPAQVHFAEEIPKGPTGKLLKRVLREKAAGHTEAQIKPNTSKAEVNRWVEAWMRTNLDIPPELKVNYRAAFADLGMDSVLSVRLARDLSNWSGCKLDAAAAWSFPTADAMAEYIASRSAVPPQAAWGDIAALSEEAAETILLAELEKMNR